MKNPFANLKNHPVQEVRRRFARRIVRWIFGACRGPVNAQPLPVIGIHRILVSHPSHTLGNTLLLTPLLGELQRVYPGAEIDVLARSPVAHEIFGGFSNVRRIYQLPRHALATPWRLIRSVRAMRSQHYDLAIDPCVRSQSDRIGVLLAKATWKLGYIGASKSGPLTHGITGSGNVHHNGKLPVYLLHRAIESADPKIYPPLDIGLTAHERARGAHALASLLATDAMSLPPLIGIFGNATGSKALGNDWWQRFARRLSDCSRGYRIVELLPAAGISLLGDRFPTFYTSDIRRLAGVLSQLALFISADCGVMHLACAAGARTFGLFSVTDPQEWGPYGEHDAIIEIGMRSPEQIVDALPPVPLPKVATLNAGNTTLNFSSAAQAAA
ncbi:MAG: glycosyltransferase family 9 protein [Dokdonella sp.]